MSVQRWKPSWAQGRCADKERYPEPCDCIDRLANSIMFTLIHDGEAGR